VSSGYTLVEGEEKGSLGEKGKKQGAGLVEKGVASGEVIVDYPGK